MNGQIVQAENEFTSEGTEMRFDLGSSKAVIKAASTDKKQGVVHKLFVDGNIVEEHDFR